MADIFVLSDDKKEIDKVTTGLELEYAVESFNDIQSFLPHFTKTPPKLLILDHDIADVNILQFISKIKEKSSLKNIPIIILTSPDKRSEIMNCIKLGVKEFLIKPYLTSVLMQKAKKNISGSVTGSNTAKNTQGGELNIVEEERIKKGIYRELDNLPAFPLIVQKVIKIANDKDSSAADFQSTVAKDQTLTAKMLKMANSPFYNVGRDIVLIKDAVVTLGYNTVKSIAFAAGTGKIFQKNLPQYGLAASGLWKHSLAAAVTSKTIAEHLGYNEDMCEEMFVCGLLHDIGKLILGMFISRGDKVYNAPESGIDNICNLEKKLTGFDHTEVGELIIKKWNLPALILNVVKYHHSPSEATFNSNEVAIVNFSNYICNKNRIGFSMKNKCNPELMDAVKTQLGLEQDQDKFNAIIVTCEENLKEIDKIAGI